MQGGPGTLATVESTALAGKPIVVLSDSGGAATALHAYCTGGIEAVEPRFRQMEVRVAMRHPAPLSRPSPTHRPHGPPAPRLPQQKLQAIKGLNDAYAGKQLLFFSLEDSSEVPGGLDTLDMSSSLLEAIVKMLNAPSAYERLPKGSVVKHPKRGQGTIIDILADGRRVVRFDKEGDIHRYTPHSLHKLMSGQSKKASLGQGGDQPGTRAGTVHGKNVKNVFDKMLARTLELTVVWNRPELAKKIIQGIQAEEPAAKSEVCQALQRAIELQREDVVRLILDLPGLTMEKMNMGQLYIKPDPYKFLSAHRQLQARLRMLVYEMSDTRKASRPHALYQKAVSRFFYGITPILRQELLADDYTRPNDVFYWLTCQGNETMARDVWPHCDNPVHAALLGAAISKKMATVIPQGQKAAEERARQYTAWAVGAMDMAPDEQYAHNVLERSIREDRTFTALDIALSTKAKDFLFNRHCISLMDRWWRGSFAGSEVSLPDDISFPLLLLHIYVPFTNRLLWPDKKKEKNKQEAYASTVFYDALGMAFNISSHERNKSNQAMVGTDSADPDSADPGESSAFAQRSEEHTPAVRTSEMSSTQMSKFRQMSKFSEILKQSTHSESLEEVVEQQRKCLSRVRAFYAIPAVKFISRLIFHAVLTLLYMLLIIFFEKPSELVKSEHEVGNHNDLPFVHTFEKSMPGVEIAWMLFELGLWLDKRHQQFVQSTTVRPGVTLRVAYLGDLLFVAAVVLRFAMNFTAEYETAFGYYETYQVLISFKAFLVIALDWFPFISEYQPVGVLYIMVIEMVGDVFTWMALFSVMTSAFMILLSGLQNARMYTNYDDICDEECVLTNIDSLTKFNHEQMITNFKPYASPGALWAPLWALFGEFDPGRYNHMTAVVIWVYCLTGSVVLVNLLVAMFADTCMPSCGSTPIGRKRATSRVRAFISGQTPESSRRRRPSTSTCAARGSSSTRTTSCPCHPCSIYLSSCGTPWSACGIYGSPSGTPRCCLAVSAGGQPPAHPPTPPPPHPSPRLGALLRPLPMPPCATTPPHCRRIKRRLPPIPPHDPQRPTPHLTAALSSQAGRKSYNVAPPTFPR